ncbi:CaiB/BaiF CoA transferase family protein [Chloroflexota bacterium]
MGPCQGIKIVDTSRYLPGRFCTNLLADMGAEVVTVEPPSDPASKVSSVGSDTGARYLALNRNKQSITLDLNTEAGRDVFYRLISRSDAVVESFRPGAADKMGIGYKTLGKYNPRLVYCAISSFGQSGPYAALPGHDLNILSLAGVLQNDEQPCLPSSLLIGSTISSLMSTIGILGALISAKETGKGQYVDVSMLDALISCLNIRATRVLRTGKDEDRSDFTDLKFPCYTTYPTKDGRRLSIGAVEPHIWKRLCRFARRPDFIDHQFDERKNDEMFSFFRELFMTKEVDEWIAILKEHDIPCAKVNRLSEALADEQVLHRDMVCEVDHPVLGRIKQLGIPIKYSDTPGDVSSTAPLYGQDTVRILKRIGYSDSEINGFRRGGIID